MKTPSRALMIAGALLFLAAIGFTFSQFRIAGVENRVTKIERGNPCIEQGSDSAACQKGRDLFAKTITFSQACAIVKKANPDFRCVQPKGVDAGNGNQSPPGQPGPPSGGSPETPSGNKPPPSPPQVPSGNTPQAPPAQKPPVNVTTPPLPIVGQPQVCVKPLLGVNCP